MGQSKRNFEEMVQEYNKQFIEHVKNEAYMYEQMYYACLDDTRYKDIE
tara:strand:- start:836 stop:979 length:144 start_codon:yes stop_codon:yes gene_type:complete